MKLEEALKEINYAKSFKTSGILPKWEAIETVLNELNKLQEKDNYYEDIQEAYNNEVKRNEELEDKLKDLDEHYSKLYKFHNRNCVMKNDYISKDKVKERIDKLDKEYNEILSDYGNIDTDITFNIPNENVRKYLNELVIKIIILQELLGDDKNART